PLTDSDTIRILIATDSHVGYNERDPIRGDDSWQSFHEVMQIAKDRDVDMVLLSGDLFHENKPSRKAMYQAMKTLRETCLGDKPCELQILSDTSNEFQSAGGVVNYENPDINVAIPVFSIHGNHDDPSGEGRLCALDLLAVAGLVNYFGRTPENDNITVNPVLLQKGSTKLALYGMSNVRDERLFRTFRDKKVKFLQPEAQKKQWFNLMCVHQNHHGHTETGYLPENFLPGFLDLVIWGHEHECLIDPRPNPEMGFSVIQPGSSIATSLCEGEAVPKHCGILSVTNREFSLEKIRLTTVRPFVMREIILAEEKELKNVWKKTNNRTTVTSHLTMVVDELIEEAIKDWMEAQDDPHVRREDAPLPLVRLRVEYTAPEGHFEVENPQRFSNRFVGKVANVNDIIQFYRKKSGIRAKKSGTGTTATELPELAQYGGSIENIRVETLVKEFLDKATLEILPSNGLGDAVGQFVEKDDRHAVETFVDESLKAYLKKMKEYDELDEENIGEIIVAHKSYLEEAFEKGQAKVPRRQKLREKPDEWESDFDGHWADNPAARIRSDEEDNNNNDDNSEASEPEPEPAARTTSTRGRGRGRSRGARGGRGATTASTTRKPAARKATTTTTTTTTAITTGRSKKKAIVIDDEEEDDEDTPMPDVPSDDTEVYMEEAEPPPPPKPRTATRKPAAIPKTTTTKRAPAATKTQSQLNFAPATRTTRGGSSNPATVGGTQTTTSGTQRTGTQPLFKPLPRRGGRQVYTIPSDDDDEEEVESDEEDEFQPLPSQRARRR
ncbi:DNA repair exonuclease, partial [Ascodesmis nigricans]